MNARKFTRYPTDTPISFVVDTMIGEHHFYLKDAGQGGLCFNAHGCIGLGTHLKIKIPLSKTALNTQGKISWCQPLENGQCQLGIEFEQKISLCDIEKVVLTH